MEKIFLTTILSALITTLIPAQATRIEYAEFKSQREAQAYFDAKSPITNI